MAKGKYQEYLTEDGLLLITAENLDHGDGQADGGFTDVRQI